MAFFVASTRYVQLSTDPHPVPKIHPQGLSLIVLLIARRLDQFSLPPPVTPEVAGSSLVARVWTVIPGQRERWCAFWQRKGSKRLLPR
jgi:hypothetical protein